MVSKREGVFQTLKSIRNKRTTVFKMIKIDAPFQHSSWMKANFKFSHVVSMAVALTISSFSFSAFGQDTEGLAPV